MFSAYGGLYCSRNGEARVAKRSFNFGNSARAYALIVHDTALVGFTVIRLELWFHKAYEYAVFAAKLSKYRCKAREPDETEIGYHQIERCAKLLWICHTNVGALEYDHARILTQ